MEPAGIKNYSQWSPQVHFLLLLPPTNDLWKELGFLSLVILMFCSAFALFHATSSPPSFWLSFISSRILPSSRCLDHHLRISSHAWVESNEILFSLKSQVKLPGPSLWSRKAPPWLLSSESWFWMLERREFSSSSSSSRSSSQKGVEEGAV